MSKRGRRPVAIAILLTFTLLVALGIWQLNGDPADKPRVGQTMATVAFNDITFAVPETWSVVHLTREMPCAPAQDRTVVVATSSFGGDCRSAKSNDTIISVSSLTLAENGSLEKAVVGNTNGWLSKEKLSTNERWIVGLPDSNTQITFSGPIDDKTRDHVINSVHKGA